MDTGVTDHVQVYAGTLQTTYSNAFSPRSIVVGNGSTIPVTTS